MNPKLLLQAALGLNQAKQAFGPGRPPSWQIETPDSAILNTLLALFQQGTPSEGSQGLVGGQGPYPSFQRPGPRTLGSDDALMGIADILDGPLPIAGTVDNVGGGIFKLLRGGGGAPSRKGFFDKALRYAQEREGYNKLAKKAGEDSPFLAARRKQLYPENFGIQDKLPELEEAIPIHERIPGPDRGLLNKATVDNATLDYISDEAAIQRRFEAHHLRDRILGAIAANPNKDPRETARQIGQAYKAKYGGADPGLLMALEELGEYTGYVPSGKSPDLGFDEFATGNLEAHIDEILRTIFDSNPQRTTKFAESIEQNLSKIPWEKRQASRDLQIPFDELDDLDYDFSSAKVIPMEGNPISPQILQGWLDDSLKFGPEISSAFGLDLETASDIALYATMLGSHRKVSPPLKLSNSVFNQTNMTIEQLIDRLKSDDRFGDLFIPF